MNEDRTAVTERSISSQGGRGKYAETGPKRREEVIEDGTAVKERSISNQGGRGKCIQMKKLGYGGRRK